MRDSAIRQIAACDKSSRIAAAFFDSTVQIWCWEKAQQVGEFETVLDFGGRRLVLAAEGSICIAGSWKRGLAAYSVPDGRCLWWRSDLKHVQVLTLGASAKEVNCGFEDRPLAVIDVKTGTTLKTVKDASRIICSRFGLCALERQRSRYRVVGEHVFDIAPMSFALVDGAFSPEAVCIAEPHAGIRCIELVSAEQLWHHKPLWSRHLTFCESDYNFYCAAKNNTEPHELSLLRLAPRLIDCDQMAFVGLVADEAFSQSGNVLVTTRGDVYETASGRVLAELDFPQRDYPDP
jgi:hypothetical protein